MSYKIVRRNEAATYEAAKHFDVRTTRLHNPEDVPEGSIVMGLSHFLLAVQRWRRPTSRWCITS